MCYILIIPHILIDRCWEVCLGRVVMVTSYCFQSYPEPRIARSIACSLLSSIAMASLFTSLCYQYSTYRYLQLQRILHLAVKFYYVQCSVNKTDNVQYSIQEFLKHNLFLKYYLEDHDLVIVHYE